MGRDGMGQGGDGMQARLAQPAGLGGALPRRWPTTRATTTTPSRGWRRPSASSASPMAAGIPRTGAAWRMLWTISPSPTLWYSRESHPHHPGARWSRTVGTGMLMGSLLPHPGWKHLPCLEPLQGVSPLRYVGQPWRWGEVLECSHHLFMAPASFTPFLAPTWGDSPGTDAGGRGMMGTQRFRVTPPLRQTPVTEGWRGTWPSTRSCWRRGWRQAPDPCGVPMAPACRAAMPTRSCASARGGRWGWQGGVPRSPTPPLSPSSYPPWSSLSPAVPGAASAP